MPLSRFCRKKTASWLHGCEPSGEKWTSIFAPVVPPVGFNQTHSLCTVTGVSALFHKLTAGDHVHPHLTNTPHLFVSLFFPLGQLRSLPAQMCTQLTPPSWYGTNYQARGLAPITCIIANTIANPAPVAVSCALLCFTHRPEQTAAAFSHLWQATVGTGWNLARRHSRAVPEGALAQEALTTHRSAPFVG